MTQHIIDKVTGYYSQKVKKYGNSSQGVDWNSEASHELRFQQLCKLLPDHQSFSLLDYGCGYGALVNYLSQNDIKCQYTGYDISDEMIKRANEAFSSGNTRFTSSLDSNEYDYSIANGVFNVKLDTSNTHWEKYTLDILHELNASTNLGFSFNILTSYSDKNYMKEHLYYADPLFYFDYCKKHFSKNIALLHDYDLYEFTIIARKHE